MLGIFIEVETKEWWTMEWITQTSELKTLIWHLSSFARSSFNFSNSLEQTLERAEIPAPDPYLNALNTKAPILKYYP